MAGTAGGGTGAGGNGAGRDLTLLGEIAPDALAAAFPVWRKPARTGDAWITMRSGIQEHSGPGSLIRRSLSALTLDALAEKLHLQAYLDGLSPDELAAVWREHQLPAPGTAGRP